MGTAHRSSGRWAVPILRFLVRRRLAAEGGIPRGGAEVVGAAGRGTADVEGAVLVAEVRADRVDEEAAVLILDAKRLAREGIDRRLRQDLGVDLGDGPGPGSGLEAVT